MNSKYFRFYNFIQIYEQYNDLTINADQIAVWRRSGQIPSSILVMALLHIAVSQNVFILKEWKSKCKRKKNYYANFLET